MSSGILKERLKEQLEEELQYVRTLASNKKRHEAIKQEKKRKKKTVEELLQLVCVSNILEHKLNEPRSYIPRSYNLDRQVVGLINYLFVRYPTPYFLYKVCINNSIETRFAYMYDTYRDWFVTIAQGGSFAKKVKGIMTSKEAYLFLKAPNHYSVHENVWWAKMTVAGIPDHIISKLMDKIFTNYFFDDPDGRLAEVINFFAHNYAAIHKEEFGAISDFIAWKIANDRNFRFKGRTVSSMIKLTNEWHVLIQKAKLGTSVEWYGSGVPYWQYATNDCVWDVRELMNNKELMNEGRAQKHCVYSYVSRCVDGSTFIYSLRKYRKHIDSVTKDGDPIYALDFELTRVTFQANTNRTIIQIRGLQNQSANEEEMNMLKLWAGEKGFTFQRLY